MNWHLFVCALQSEYFILTIKYAEVCEKLEGQMVHKKLQVLLIILVCCFLGLQVLGAATQNFQIIQSDSSVSSFRYHINDDAWIESDIKQNKIAFPSFDVDHDILSIQQYSNSSGWGPNYSYRFDVSKKTWVGIKNSQKTLHFTIGKTDSSIVALRYQTGLQETQDWTTVPVEQNRFTLPWFDTDEVLFVQQSWDWIHWSDSYAYRYDIKTNTWSLVTKPKAKDDAYSVAIYGHATKTQEKMDLVYDLGYGGGLEATMIPSFNRRLAIIMDVLAQYAKSASIWSNTILSVKGTLSLGYQYPVAERVLLLPSVGYGALVVLCDAGTFVDQVVEASLKISLPVNDQLLVMLKANADLVIEKSGYGLIYGVSAGIQFGW